MNERDLELLSAYLDGQLNPSDSARLESRLASDKELSTALDNLRSTRSLLRQLPSRHATRNFTLTPQMAGIKPPTPRVVPAFRFASVAATFLFIITFLINGLLSFSAAAPTPVAFNAAAPMAAQEAATEAPALPPAADLLTETTSPRVMAAPQSANETPMLLAGGQAPVSTDTSTPEMALKAAPSQANHNAQTIPSQKETSSLPLDFEIVFAILAIGFGMTAWILPRNSERNFRNKWNKKRD